MIADQDHPMPGYRQAISGNLRPSSSVLFWQSRNCGPILPRSGRSTPLPCRALRPFSGHLGLSSNSALNPGCVGGVAKDLPGIVDCNGVRECEAGPDASILLRLTRPFVGDMK